MSNAKRLGVYFENDNQAKVYKKIVRLSKKTGMSMSRIGYLALLYGLPRVAESVSGIYIDAEANNEALEKELPTYSV